MKLGPLLKKLLHQLGNVGPDRTRVDVCVVRKVLDRKLGEEVSKTAERVAVDRHAVQRVVAHLAQAVGDLTAAQTEPKLAVAASGPGQHVTEMWAAVLFGQLLPECGKALQDSGHLQIRGLL